MSPEMEQKAREILKEAIGLPPERRSRFLDLACAESAELRREAGRLLEIHQQSNDITYLVTPAGSASGIQAQQIGRYLIKGELGRGAMGAVYEAVDPVIGRTVALKVLHAGQGYDPSESKAMEDRLYREASSAGRLAHPGIVTVFDVGKQADIAFIAMERVEGPTLQQLVKEKKLERTQILDMLRQAASALDYAHGEGIIHRDIKPANIMLHKGTQAKIADFGIAKVSAMSQLTAAGTILGTPSYMSPEQIQNTALSGSSDQFSLAVLAYELLTGVKPFERDTMAALLLAIVNGARPSAHSVDPTLPKDVDEVFEMALNKSPEARFATCAAFVNALASALGMGVSTPTGVATGIQSVAAPPPPPPPLPPPPPPPSSRTVLPLPPPPPVSPTAVRPAQSKAPLYVAGAFLLIALAAAYPVYRYVYPKPVATPPAKAEAKPEAQIAEVAIPPVKPGAPAVSLFTVEPDTIQPGATATLRWWVTDAAEVVINQDVGKVAGKGSLEVKPPKTTEYVLTATGPGGDATARVSVTVGSAIPPQNVAPKQVAVAPPKPAAPAVDPSQAGKLYDEAMSKHRAGQSGEALPLLKQAAGMGEARAMLELGRVYSSGDGATKDGAEATRWYRKSAEAGNASAMVFLGANYAQSRDYTEAAKWIRKAAEAGNVAAMDGLGQMYASGQGVPVDAAQSAVWYRKAVSAGNPAAMYHLGLLLQSTQPAEANQLFQQAAAAGYAAAKAKLTQAPGGLTLTSIEPAGIVEGKGQLYSLTGSGFSAATTVRTSLPGAVGSRDGKSDSRPLAVSPNGNLLKIFITLQPQSGKDSVQILAKNPGGPEVSLTVPIQR